MQLRGSIPKGSGCAFLVAFSFLLEYRCNSKIQVAICHGQRDDLGNVTYGEQ